MRSSFSNYEMKSVYCGGFIPELKLIFLLEFSYCDV